MHTHLNFHCVTVYLRHRPSITVSNTRTCIPHSSHNPTYYKYHSTRFFVLLHFFYSLYVLLVFALPASVRAYLAIFAFQFLELDTFPLDNFSFPFPFSWSRVFDDCSISPHHITSHYHTLISSSFIHSQFLLLIGFGGIFVAYDTVVGWK